jgi:hypothetical protein
VFVKNKNDHAFFGPHCITSKEAEFCDEKPHFEGDNGWSESFALILFFLYLSVGALQQVNCFF